MKLNQQTCNHQWKITQGFSHTYTDCTLCGAKYEDFEAWKSQESHEIWTPANNIVWASNDHISNREGITIEMFEEVRNKILNDTIDTYHDNFKAIYQDLAVYGKYELPISNINGILPVDPV